MKHEVYGKMMTYVWIAIYVLCSAFGLTLIKMGVNKGAEIAASSGVLTVRLGLIAILGLILYIVSFLLSMGILSKMDLSYFYPVSAGLVYIIVCILSCILLKEPLSLPKIIGMAAILAGVVMMNLKF